MSVVAKMYVSQLTQAAWSPGARKVELQVVSRAADNAAWSAATPSGSITMNVNNEVAAAEFEIGEEYLVTFTKVKTPSAR